MGFNLILNLKWDLILITILLLYYFHTHMHIYSYSNTVFTNIVFAHFKPFLKHQNGEYNFSFYWN